VSRRPRNTALRVLVGATLVLAVIVGALVFYTNHQLGNIPRFPLDLDRPGRPAATAGDALNILIAGVDDPDGSGKGPTVGEALAGRTWPQGAFRSDAIMVLHLSADRHSAQLVSIPRDSYVDVAGHGRTKINAAFSYGGPQLLARTVEDLGGIRVDHVVVVDFQGLARITDIVGGVEVYLTRPTYDPVSKTTWDAGLHHLDGAQALAYVRERHTLLRGDLDRVQRQQNLLRALLGRLVRTGTIVNPVRLLRLTRQLSSTIAVDEGLDPGTMRGLALGSRSLRPSDLTFATVPVTGTPTIHGASVVTLDLPQTESMLRSLSDGALADWLDGNHADRLPGRRQVR
jgi:LCP family protein required for cell wall assembly